VTLLFVVIASTLLAGLGMTVGAALACFKMRWINNEVQHGIVAFGGGALLSAVALVLVPEGMEHTTPFTACAFFILGGLCFMFLDIFLKKINTPASQLAAMVSDFIPESIALGAAFATGSNGAFLLAGLIALHIMLFASGGILYSIFQDLAPKVILKNHLAPPMGAVLGFVFGMLGFMLTAA